MYVLQELGNDIKYYQNYRNTVFNGNIGKQ